MQPSVTLERVEDSGFLLSSLLLRYPELPKSLRGLRMLQLSDIHYGPATPRQHLERAVDFAATLKADLLLLTGDYLQISTSGLSQMFLPRAGMTTEFRYSHHRAKIRELTKDLAKLLDTLQPPLGILSVPGNHDYSEGLRIIRSHLGKEITWLINQAHSIHLDGASIHFAGIDDIRYGKPLFNDSIQALIERSKDSTNPAIFLSHNPDIVLAPQSQQLSAADLILCGHTHGGQVRFPGIGALMTQTRQREHVQGLSWFAGTPLYVSNGLGYGGIRLRLNCPPELVLIELA